jgi:hypothetical protein
MICYICWWVVWFAIGVNIEAIFWLLQYQELLICIASSLDKIPIPNTCNWVITYNYFNLVGDLWIGFFRPWYRPGIYPMAYRNHWFSGRMKTMTRRLIFLHTPKVNCRKGRNCIIMEFCGEPLTHSPLPNAWPKLGLILLSPALISVD